MKSRTLRTCAAGIAIASLGMGLATVPTAQAATTLTSKEQLKSASVPSMCGHPAGTLKDGKLPGHPVSLDYAKSKLGQIKLGGGKEMDYRVSVLPTLWGEKICLRLLDKSNLQLDMTKLGFEPEPLKWFKEQIDRPYGMVLVTGPTGSGKTTTLYSALAALNDPTTNVSTAEDPVEYNLAGINQVQVKGTTFIDPSLFTLNNMVSSNLQPQNFESKTRIAGYFVQGQADLWNKVFLTVALRADQSSTFPKKDRTNYYPKASLAWNLIGGANSGGSGFINYLKARTAYGTVGREPFAYQILDSYTGSPASFAYGGGSTNPTQSGIGGLTSSTTRGAPTLKPERTAELEAGFDFGVWNSKIDGTLTYYDAKTTDVIFSLPTPASTGFRSQRWRYREGRCAWDGRAGSAGSRGSRDDP